MLQMPLTHRHDRCIQRWTIGRRRLLWLENMYLERRAGFLGFRHHFDGRVLSISRLRFALGRGYLDGTGGASCGAAQAPSEPPKPKPKLLSGPPRPNKRLL